MDNNLRQNSSLKQLVTSKGWTDYFHSLSQSSGFEFNVYNRDANSIFITKENPLCKYIKSAGHDGMECRESCRTLMDDEDTPGKSVHKCEANVLNFALPFGSSGDGLVVGRGGLASYDDLMDFLKVVKESSLPAISFRMPFDFPGEDYVDTVSRHVALAVDSMAGNSVGKFKIEEKLLRMTSLFDRKTFRTLSRNPELMYRYILDTIGFVFGQMSAFFLVPDRKGVYKSVYTAGAHKDMVIDFQMDAENPAIRELIDTESPVYYENAEEFKVSAPFDNIKHFYFYPIFAGSLLQGVIGIFDKELFREDLKIMNAFNDYIQLNIENFTLRTAVQRSKAADEKLSVFMEFSNTASSLLDMHGLSNAMLEKSLQLIGAEQGSLMFLDDNQTELVIEAKKSRDDTVKVKMRIKREGCIADIVLQSGESLLVEDIESDPRIKKQNRARYKTKSFVCVPIIIDDKVAGVLNISDKVKNIVFSHDDLHLIQSFIKNISIIIERNILHKKSEALEKLSITDPLTGIYNRRYLNDRLMEEITRYNRYKHPFSFMILDLDKFKLFNDTYGHLAGDNLIKNLAKLMENSLRTIDIAARFGGDEFVAIFPQTPKEDAIQIINRIKDKIDAALNIDHGTIFLSVSMGLATYPDDASSMMELIEKTDQALYLAKKGGGNRVVHL
ncbi:MAG TPA: GGDEF domain-containing protein [Nitrospirae bacterium]|nr:phytochrome-like protein cph2 [bacterium BMS3Abin09]GBE41401.1 phytochrome-like protein cph2 [bacterium BMS3Bbin09]HDH34787.1 GGDEF domain-containing protein [Nitrospirota bacterium]HDN95311.1 GGDEF domain-containing protein [Nitrospirota bacterium]HDO67288.1 GGDEF domain-containing protein [Nitrospirota bacterium]